jgi:hypothetical protein
MTTPCSALQDTIADLVSNTLPEDRQAKVLAHLDGCPACRQYFLALYQEHLALARLADAMDVDRQKSLNRALDRLGTQPQPTLWRKNMTKKIVPFAAAAAILITAGLALWFTHQTALTAYALQDTIDAFKKTQTLHIFGRDWQERKVEVWAKLNPEDLSVVSCRVEEPEKGKTTVCTPKQMWIFDQKKNEVEIPIGAGAYSAISLGSFLENVQTMNQDFKGTMTTEYKYDPEFLQEVICVDVKTPLVELRAVLSPENKLPLRVNVGKGTTGNFQYGLIKNADRILYNEVLPEGLFDFRIPAGAKVIDQRAIATTPLNQLLSPEVIAWAMKYHAGALKNAGITTPLYTNTQIYVFDRQRRWTWSGIIEVGNHSNVPMSGEQEVTGTSQSNMEVYDPSGKKQKSRLVKSMLGENFYRLYVTPDTPLLPGESRLYLWVAGQPRQLFNANSEKLYYAEMQNRFGPEVLENFILVVPAQVAVRTQTESPTLTQQIGDVQIYVWQKRVPTNQTHYVKVGLDIGSLVQ